MSKDLNLSYATINNIKINFMDETPAHTVGLLDKKYRPGTICQHCRVDYTNVKLQVIDNFIISGSSIITLPDVIAYYCHECYTARKYKCWYTMCDYTVQEIVDVKYCAIRDS